MNSEEQRVVTVKDLGIKVGDLVMVTGWEGSGVYGNTSPYWVGGMDDTVGKNYTVAMIHNQSSVRLIDGDILMCNYHPAWIEPVDKYSTIRKQLLTM